MFFTYYFSIPWISSLCGLTFFFLSEIRSIIGHRNSSFHLLFHLFSVSSMNREFAGEGQQLHHLFTCKRLGFKNSFNPWNTLFQGVKLLVSNGVETNNEIAWLILLNDVIRVSGYLILFTMKRRWKNGSSPENSLLIGDTEEEWRGWKNCAYYRERILNCS